ncbi:RNAse P, Rpr2/Rpp21 subunit family-containing protein [Strongyloides ratti]|uniref:RNAse P, Rpr2/Rpp21 subunit family-containing protein n=1 Tax=Strongyloides ratti TaxID=34506 RepID=A0A090LFP0_STRRB|nr:RNAse P, Rpr2/Rpp21 subunit family-containing protein [Strongyloides ratti]CEF66300.1 RNAse P, Rpr2/Rpp21 subunit family-containing protein [Strongyloides ratti]
METDGSVLFLHQRCNFLQKIAIHLAVENEKLKSKNVELLERRINKEMREISFGNKVNLDQSIKRNICKNKKCMKTLTSESIGIKLKTNSKKQHFIIRKCKSCNFSTKYLLKK